MGKLTRIAGRAGVSIVFPADPKARVYQVVQGAGSGADKELGTIYQSLQGDGDWFVTGQVESEGHGSPFCAAKALAKAVGVPYEGQLSSPAGQAGGFNAGEALAIMAGEFRWAYPEAPTAAVAGFIIGRAQEPGFPFVQAMQMACMGDDTGRWIALRKVLSPDVAIATAERSAYKDALMIALQALRRLGQEAKEQGDRDAALMAAGQALFKLTPEQWAALGMEF